MPCMGAGKGRKAWRAPTGIPGLADFAVDTKDNSKARFNLKEAKSNVDFMIEKDPEFFNKSHKESWDHFSNSFLRTVEDMVETDATRLTYFTECDLPQCGLRLAGGSALCNHQACFAFIK
eukprot:6203651-Pleurochrysis_carterae.AAC.1